MARVLQVYAIIGDPYFKGPRRNRREMLQVTILDGEGSTTRSYTRHVERISRFNGLGRNSDAAQTLNDNAEAELSATENVLSNREATLAKAQEGLLALKGVRSKTATAERAELKTWVKKLKAAVADLTIRRDEAKAYLEYVQREHPRQAHFDLRDAKTISATKSQKKRAA